ncbi:MAG: DNA recombination protein RmuC, partial [Paludibacteraceae bacterium]|nr:DNA recombination protein RmuC [Paludibacteraceae bacterium]
MDILLAVVIGVIIGALIGFIVSKLKNQEKQVFIEKLQWQLENEKSSAEQNAIAHQKQIETIKTEAKEQIESIKTEYDKRIAEIRLDEEKKTNEMLSSQEKHYQQVIRTQQDLVKETVEKFDAQIKNSTDEMLKQRQKEFAESSTSNIEKLLSPLRENMEKMKQTMNENALKHTAINSEMKVKLEDMMKHSESAKQSAEELARVLKHKSKVQGDWGERILNEILESQGLTEGIHYETQSTIRDAAGNVVKTDTGGNLRPDVIMHIDYNRDIIIDSKVSLTAFMDFVNAETEEERQIHLKAHIDSIQKHVKELSKKDYSSY